LKEKIMSDMHMKAQQLRESVIDYRDSHATEVDRQLIRDWWKDVGVPNQFAALLLAAELEKSQ